jgi:hypothetical protein
VLSTGASAEVGGEPAATADADAGAGDGAGAAVEVVHHLVLRGSTTRQSSHNLSLLGFLVGVECIVRDHDVADELWECPSSVEHHALL